MATHPGHKQATSAQSIEDAEKRVKALELRKEGYTLDQIAEKMGYADRSGVYQLIKRALASMVTPDIAEYRALDAERLDRLFLAVWKPALEGDLKAMDRCLRILEQRARLFGLNAPVQVGVTGEVVTYTYVGVDVNQV